MYLRKDVYNGYFDGWYTLRCYQMQREGREVKSFAPCYAAALPPHKCIPMNDVYVHTYNYIYIYIYIELVLKKT